MPAPKQQRRVKKNPSPLTTDDIPREVCKNLSQQVEAETTNHNEELPDVKDPLPDGVHKEESWKHGGRRSNVGDHDGASGTGQH